MDRGPRSLDHFPPAAFDRVDPRPDPLFYDFPRLVTHIDEGAITAVGALIERLAPAGAAVLDLMSSYASHLPAGLQAREVVGVGLNAAELAANQQLTRWYVQDVNVESELPEADGAFDLALCTVSVQYLTAPLEVFAAVRRVLRPGAAFLVTFSNRCFPTKAVRMWHAGGDREHLQLVRAYFDLSGDWSEPEAAAHQPAEGDPLYGVWARRADASAVRESAGQ